MNVNRPSWFLSGTEDRASRARLRLFCFHYAGSGASIFNTWERSLPEDIELVAVQLPGRENRLDEALLLSMEAVTMSLVNEFPSFLDKPFAFFGHSTGALISFEVARVLRQLTLPQPRLLIVSAQNAPSIKPKMIRHNLADAEFIAVLRRYKGTPDAVLDNPELLEILLPRIRADGAVCETYLYERQAPLDCRIVVFYGTDDNTLDDSGITGWESEAGESFGCYGFPGGHFFLHEKESNVLEHISRELQVLLNESASVSIG